MLSAAWLALPRAYQRGATPPRKTVLSWQPLLTALAKIDGHKFGGSGLVGVETL